jgi:L,D-transpeptidase ErfK/SrfK
MTGRRTSIGIAAMVVALTAHARLAQDDARLLTGRQTTHVVVAGETLTSVGARYGVTPRVLAKLNGLRADARLQIGRVLFVDGRHLVPAFAGERLLINVPQRMLFLLEEHGAIAGFPIAVGRSGWPTFLGPFTVDTLETNPVWDVPPSIQAEQRRAGKPVLTHVPAGPNNPLGDFWLGLSRPGFGIHSTNAPSSIYQVTTHGCIRLHPDDARYVFSRAAVGMSGRSTYEPVLLARLSDGAILLEAHPDVYRRQPDAMAFVRGSAAALGVTDDVDWQAVAVALKLRDGVPTAVALPSAR